MSEPPPPPPPPPPTPPVVTPVASSAFDESEILAEQFENYLRIAKALLNTLKRPKDIEICTKLLRMVQRLNDSKTVDVKRNNNTFFRYCLRVLKWTSRNQRPEPYECPQAKEKPKAGFVGLESRLWLEENKSYVAFKVIEGGGLLIYSAIATDPSAGWQEGGLNILAKKNACDK